MKAVDFLVLIILLGLLAAGSYFLWLNLPGEKIEFESYNANLSYNLPSESSQFYPNMRYVEKDISYSVSRSCNAQKKLDVERAFATLEGITILNFYSSENSPEIVFSCSNISPEPEEEGHFVAGEGGPSIIINSSRYAVIKAGKVALYREEKCDTPQVAIHEILHALGFDHNNNKNSIMYPVTDCNQKIDETIIEEINRLYSEPSLGDLIIEKAEAEKSGRYLSAEVLLANYGLKDVQKSELEFLVNGKIIKSFEMNEINVGAKKSLSITNLRIPGDTEEVLLVVKTSELEISKTNNEAIIKLSEN
ncbi:matrixin family metalloprotease [Candidatus Pacearchaeota archaeon]|nr:matrixin family metalloprotease [Candidatus Pacearchaeota archaeon]